MTKRYALFAGEDYYPHGGADDFIAFVDTPEEGRALFDFGYYQKWNDPNDPDSEKEYYHWGHLVEVATMKIVRKYQQDRRRSQATPPTIEEIVE